MSNTGIQRPNWANGITLTNETTAEDVTNYIDFKINEYTKYNFKDKSLWDSYQEDFDNFEVQTFKDADRSAIKRLKQLLRRNGVWVFNKKSKSVPQALYDVAHEDDRTEWSNEEIKLFINNEGPFNSYAINYRLKSRSSTPLTSSATLALALAVSNDLPPAAKLPLPMNVTAVSNDLPTAEPPLPTNITAVSNDLPTAEPPSPTNTTAPPTNVTAVSNDLPPTAELPLPTDVTATSTNVTAPPTYNPNIIYCLPYKSVASKITSTARPKRQRAPPPPTAFASHEYYVNRVYILVVLRTKKELPALEYIDRVYRLNDCAVTPTIRLSWHRTAIYHQTNSAAMPAITILIANTPAAYQSNNRAYMPTINRPTDRRALCLTTITTAAGTILPFFFYGLFDNLA